MYGTVSGWTTLVLPSTQKLLTTAESRDQPAYPSLLWKQVVLTKVVYELDYLMCNVRQYNDYLITKLTANLRGRGMNICAWTHDIVIYCSWALPFSFMMCVPDHKRVYLLTISPSVCSSSRPTTTSNHCCCLMENPHAGPGSMPAPCQRRQLSISTTVPQDWAYQLGSLEDLVKGTAWLKPLEDGWSLWFSTTWVSTLLTPKQAVLIAAVLNAAGLLSIKGLTQLHMTSFGGIRDLENLMYVNNFI